MSLRPVNVLNASSISWTLVSRKKSCMKRVIIKEGEQYYKHNKTSTLYFYKLLWKNRWTMYEQDIQRAFFILKPH